MASKRTSLKRRNSALEQKLVISERRNSMLSLMSGSPMPNNMTNFNDIYNNNIVAPITMLWPILSYFYKTHGIIQTAIDQPVLDSLRGGLEFESDQIEADELKILEQRMEEEDDLDVVSEATVWRRLFGGGAVIVNTDQDPRLPLDLNKKINMLRFYAADRWELSSEHADAEFYDYYGIRLHRSRVLIMKGKAAPRLIKYQLQGWGMSEVERIVEDFNRYIKTADVLYELLNEAKLDVFGLDGLNEQLVSGEGTEIVRQRVELANKLKNFNRALIMDKNDVYEQKQIAFSGLAEVWKENRLAVASACRMPVTKLFGQSASGLNASSEDDIENYNGVVESEVRVGMRPVLRQLIKIRCAYEFQLPDVDIKFKFKPLRILGAVEEEGIKSSKSNRILAWQGAGNLTRVEAAEQAEKEGLIAEGTDASKGLLDEFGNPNEPEPEAPAKGGGK